MRWILRCTVCLTLASCSNLMPPNMDPVAIQVPARSSRFVGDTLILSVVDRTEEPLRGGAFQSALATTMRAAFPAAVVSESLIDIAPAPRRVFVTVSIVRYAVSYPHGRWAGHTGIDIFVFDHRVSPGSRLVSFIRTSDTSGVFHWGNKTIGDVSRASFDNANAALIAFLDSVGDPRSREPLRSTAEVSEAEYAPFLAETGNASLTGRASITADDGTEHPSAGQPVTLDPATSSARRWYERFGMVCRTFDLSASPDDLFRRTRRKTVTDADGNFTFTGLPPGTYFVRTRVLWDAPTPNDLFRTIAQQYAFVSSAVTLKEGEQTAMALTKTGNAYLRCPSPRGALGGRPKPGFVY
jgi:hypothetical protein